MCLKLSVPGLHVQEKSDVMCDLNSHSPNRCKADTKMYVSFIVVFLFLLFLIYSFLYIFFIIYLDLFVFSCLCNNYNISQKWNWTCYISHAEQKVKRTRPTLLQYFGCFNNCLPRPFVLGNRKDVLKLA